MTELLCFPDNEYQKEFDAKVTKTREATEEHDGWIYLNQTLFYKEGGGQPEDHGKINWNGETAEIVEENTSATSKR